MPFYPLRPVPVPDPAGALYDAWLEWLDAELERPDCDRYALCRQVLTDLFHPEYAGVDPTTLSRGIQLNLAQLDARSVTLEPEYYHEIDLERYAQVKPLIWMWEMFDRSVLGENVHVGVRFRRTLARRIFARCGRNFKAFHHVKLSFGYNLEVGDDVVVHRHVLLDDRGGIRLGDRVSVSDFVNVYSHSHDLVEPREVSTSRTVVGDGVRIAYHATVLAGVTLARNSMVGAGALVTRDTEADTVHVGVPARPVKRKPDRPRPPATPDPLADPL